MKTTCCSDLDWTGVDLKLEHHPDCITRIMPPIKPPIMCDVCLGLRPSNACQFRLDDLTSRIGTLLDVQGDIKANAVEGNPVYDYAIGVRTNKVLLDSALGREGQALDLIIAHITANFSQVFNGQRGRKLWWRERPAMYGQMDWEYRHEKRVVWFACAISDLTDEERDRLGYVPVR